MLFGTERNRKCVLLSVTGVYVLNTCCAHCQFARMPVVVCVFQLEGLCMVLVWRVGIGRRRSITHSPLGLSACNLEDKYTSPVAISITTSMCDRTPYTQSATRLLRTCYSMLFGPGHLRNGLVMSVAGVLVPKTQLAMFLGLTTCIWVQCGPFVGFVGWLALGRTPSIVMLVPNCTIRYLHVPTCFQLER